MQEPSSVDIEPTNTPSDADITEVTSSEETAETPATTVPVTAPSPEAIPENTASTETATPEENLQLFHVIVSSVSSSDQIEPELKRFKAKGYQPVVLTTKENSFRISIGSFGTKDSASTFKTNIKNDNDISSWILSPK